MTGSVSSVTGRSTPSTPSVWSRPAVVAARGPVGARSGPVPVPRVRRPVASRLGWARGPEQVGSARRPSAAPRSRAARPGDCRRLALNRPLSVRWPSHRRKAGTPPRSIAGSPSRSVRARHVVSRRGPARRSRLAVLSRLAQVPTQGFARRARPGCRRSRRRRQRRSPACRRQAQRPRSAPRLRRPPTRIGATRAHARHRSKRSTPRKHHPISLFRSLRSREQGTASTYSLGRARANL